MRKKKLVGRKKSNHRSKKRRRMTSRKSRSRMRILMIRMRKKKATHKVHPIFRINKTKKKGIRMRTNSRIKRIMYKKIMEFLKVNRRCQMNCKVIYHRILKNNKKKNNRMNRKKKIKMIKKTSLKTCK